MTEIVWEKHPDFERGYRSGPWEIRRVRDGYRLLENGTEVFRGSVPECKAKAQEILAKDAGHLPDMCGDVGQTYVIETPTRVGPPYPGDEQESIPVPLTEEQKQAAIEEALADDAPVAVSMSFEKPLTQLDPDKGMLEDFANRTPDSKLDPSEMEDQPLMAELEEAIGKTFSDLTTIPKVDDLCDGELGDIADVIIKEQSLNELADKFVERDGPDFVEDSDETIEDCGLHSADRAAVSKGEPDFVDGNDPADDVEDGQIREALEKAEADFVEDEEDDEYDLDDREIEGRPNFDSELNKFTRREIQEKVDALVWSHGGAVLERTDADVILSESGVARAWLTPQRLEKAILNAKRQIKQGVNPPPALLSWSEIPEQDTFQNGHAQYDIWRSTCGRYRVARVTGPESRFTVMAKMATSERIVNKSDLKSLARAFEVAEAHLRETMGREESESNAKQVVNLAESNGLSRLVPRLSATDNTPVADFIESEDTMQVQEKSVRRMLRAIGNVAAAEEMSPERLLAKLNDGKDFQALIEDWTQPEEGSDDYKLMVAIGKAAGEGRSIQYATSNGESNGKAVKGKKERPAKVAKEPKVKKAPKEKKESAERDRFGCQLGKDPALINAALSGNKRTPQKIAEECGLKPARVVRHLKFWAQRNDGLGEWLVEEDGKWGLKPNAPRNK